MPRRAAQGAAAVHKAGNLIPELKMLPRNGKAKASLAAVAKTLPAAVAKTPPVAVVKTPPAAVAKAHQQARRQSLEFLERA